jgi:hypothetical protein
MNPRILSPIVPSRSAWPERPLKLPVGVPELAAIAPAAPSYAPFRAPE